MLRKIEEKKGNLHHLYITYNRTNLPRLLNIKKKTKTKIDRCETCNTKETLKHYIHDCKKYDAERKLLEEEAENILNQSGLGHIMDINFQVLT